MKNNFRAVKSTAIIGLILVSAFMSLSVFTPDQDTAKAREPSITFKSYIDITFDNAALKQNLAIDESVYVPINITYTTNIPPLYGKIPFPFNNLIFFGATIPPAQQIHLDIVDKPDWASMFLTTPDLIITNIPYTDGDPSSVTKRVDLVISPRTEAPAVSEDITIKATCENLHRLEGTTFEATTSFTPSFLPTIQITPVDPLRTVSPRDSVNFKIIVKNFGNKITKVTPEIINPDTEWNPTINPPKFEIPPNQEEEFVFSVFTPYDFGWHDKVRSFEIKFTSEVYPYRENAPSETASIYIQAHNYGFSASGFEIGLMVIIIVVLIGIILLYKKDKK